MDSTDADVVGVGSMINALPLLIAAMRRRRTPRGQRVVVGGAGYNGIAVPLLRSHPLFDAIAVGESESIIVPLVSALASNVCLDQVPGVCYRDGDKVRQTPPPAHISNLDSLPYPAFDLTNLNDYHGVPLIASRGCPYRCTFCDVAPAWGRNHRRRSIASVVQELEYLRDRYGVSRASFVDDIFVLDRPWVIEFCAELVKRRTGVAWRCAGHINLMNHELVDRMREAGCESVFFGVESGSNEVLKEIQKGFSIERAVATVQMVAKRMAVQANLIWGYPGESTERLHKTLEAREVLTAAGATVSLVFLAPLASATMYTSTRSELIFDPEGPNIFYGDYGELVEDDRDEINDLIRQSPDVFCAFYQFVGSGTLEKSDLVGFYNATRSMRAGSTPAAPSWQSV